MEFLFRLVQFLIHFLRIDDGHLPTPIEIVEMSEIFQRFSVCQLVDPNQRRDPTIEYLEDVK